LQQRTFDAQWSADFPPTGRFVSVKVDNRSYWYFDQPDGKGGQKRRYVGPADDDEITNRVETFRSEKDDYQNRRKMVAACPLMPHYFRDASQGCHASRKYDPFKNQAVGVLPRRSERIRHS
jgi:hypothetical protein